MKTPQEKIDNKKIITRVVCLLFLIAVLGALMPRFLSDGVENYNDSQKEVVKKHLQGLTEENFLKDTNPITFSRAEKPVKFDTSKTGCRNEEDARHSDELIVIGRRTWFGVQNRVVVISPCGTMDVGDSVEQALQRLEQKYAE